MEIFILQYAIVVLICLSWAMPHRQFNLSKHLHFPFFNLQCFLVVMFIVGYTFVRDLASGNGAHWSYLILYSVVNLSLFTIIPAGYLYVRNQLSGEKIGMKDLIHCASPIIYSIFFILPHLFTPSDSFSESSDAGLFYKLFGYSVLGIYLLLVMQVLLDKYPIFSSAAKNKRLQQTADLPPAAAPVEKTATVSEVQVGSIQFARPTPHRVTIQSIMEQWLINQNAEINLPDLVEGSLEV